jgi:hypothetical protein
MMSGVMWDVSITLPLFRNLPKLIHGNLRGSWRELDGKADWHERIAWIGSLIRGTELILGIHRCSVMPLDRVRHCG